MNQANRSLITVFLLSLFSLASFSALNRLTSNASIKVLGDQDEFQSACQLTGGLCISKYSTCPENYKASITGECGPNNKCCFPPNLTTRRQVPPMPPIPNPNPNALCFRLNQLVPKYCQPFMFPLNTNNCKLIKNFVNSLQPFCKPTIPTPSHPVSPTPPPLVCEWCGNRCLPANSERLCPMVMPPVNQKCVTQNNQCLIIGLPLPTDSQVIFPSSQSSTCNWCGTRCIDSSQNPNMACPEIIPPPGVSCRLVGTGCKITAD